MATINQVFGSSAQQQIVDLLKTYDPIIAKAPYAPVSAAVSFWANRPVTRNSKKNTVMAMLLRNGFI